MGAEFIAWRGCSLQRELGPEGLVSRFKLLDLKRMVDAQVEDPQERERVRLQASGGGTDPPQDLLYTDIREGCAVVEKGIPDCEACLLSEKRPVGCRTTVSLPLDAQTETLAFEFFVTDVIKPASTSFELWRDVVRYQPPESPWHLLRDPAGTRLAELAVPLAQTVSLADGQSITVDSAMLFNSLFTTAESNAQVVAYHKWWTQLLSYSERPGCNMEGSTTWPQILRLRHLYLRTFIYGMHQPVGLLVNA